MNEQEIFASALEQEPQQRAAFLDDACRDDLQLRQRVEDLLRVYEGGGEFFEKPAAEILATVPSPIAEKPGTLIGPYKLREQIGEGGFGTVYVAEQQEPVSRKVALKIIKPGMDTKDVIARFEAERQALALMDHTNVARVLDAGATESGRPYFVMELVHGLPITEFCDEQTLTNRQRLELFIDVCRAVQHAHQKGIIHRDLKPSNIMVTMHDDKPVPKVIDFGVSKALSHKLTDKTIYTAYGQMVGTPLYMSPEQAQMSGLDVDTRSDVYSLGVLLYELLTGTTPFDKETLKKADFDEMRRIIREDEPPRPSVRVSTLNAEMISTVSDRRKVERRGLGQSLRGELDWIVMKPLEKDRNRRYESASAFAADIERYLNDEPVLACPPSAWYRARKYASKHRTSILVTAVTLVALLMAVGGIASGVGWAARDRQARQTRVSEQVAKILDEVERLTAEQRWSEALAAAERGDVLLTSVEDSKAERKELQATLSGLKLVQRLEEARILPYQSDSEPADVLVPLKRTTTRIDFASADRAYTAAFRDYGIQLETMSETEACQNLRSFPSLAIPFAVALDNWADVRRESRGQGDPSWKFLVSVASTLDPDRLRNRLRGLWSRKLTEEARKELVSLADASNLEKHPPATLYLLAKTYRQVELPGMAISVLAAAQRRYPGDFEVNVALANILYAQDREEEAIRFYSVALGLRPGVAEIHTNIAGALARQNMHKQAVAHARIAIELAPTFPGGHHNLGFALHEQGRIDEAITSYKKALELDPRSVISHTQLGTALADQQKFDEAIGRYQKAVSVDQEYAPAYVSLGSALEKQGRLAEATTRYERAIALDPEDARAHYNFGVLLWRQSKFDAASDAYRKAVQLDPDYAAAHFNLAQSFVKTGQHDQAVTHYLRADELGHLKAASDLAALLFSEGEFVGGFALSRRAIARDPKNDITHFNLGFALENQRRVVEAVASYKRALELGPNVSSIYVNLALALRSQDKLDDAILHLEKALELEPGHARANNNLGIVLKDQGKLDEAIACWQKAIEADPNYADAHANLGVTLVWNKKDDDLEAAIESLRKAVTLAPNHANAHVALGTALRKKGELAAAIRHFRRAVELDPGDTYSLQQLGDLLRREGDEAEAIACFQRALTVEPKSPVALYQLAGILAARPSTGEVIGLYRRFLEAKPDHATAVNNLAWHLTTAEKFELRNHAEAVELAQRAVVLNPDSWQIWNTLSVACYRAGDWKKALEARRKKIQRNRQSPTDDLWLSMIHWQLGQKEEARKAYEQAARQIHEKPPGRAAVILCWEAEQLIGIRPSRTGKLEGSPEQEP